MNGKKLQKHDNDNPLHNLTWNKQIKIFKNYINLEILNRHEVKVKLLRCNIILSDEQEKNHQNWILTTIFEIVSVVEVMCTCVFLYCIYFVCPCPPTYSSTYVYFTTRSCKIPLTLCNILYGIKYLFLLFQKYTF